MHLTGLHLLLTYQCNFECDHCFVWGGPQQTGTFTLDQIDEVLRQARELGTVEWIYLEGGEPFLYYAALLAAARLATEAGFRAGIVSNGYWAISERDAIESLRPFAGLIGDISISSDLYHYDEALSRQARNAHAAAAALGIPAGFIEVAKATDFGDTALWTRVNALNSPWVLDDIREIVEACKAIGMEYLWDGDPDKVIYVLPFGRKAEKARRYA